VARGRGEVSFSLVEEDDRYVFSVSDNGSGILPEFHEKIFDKYGQTGVISDNPVSGMNKGLGLTFCKLVVEAHGGKIWVESDSGKGSIFRFTVLKR
jgi:signal transduction histidine kinase